MNKCNHYKELLKEDDRHYVNSLEHNNCVLCLVNEKGNMTQEENSKYLGISKMRVCQIEAKAVKRMKKRMMKHVD